MVWNANRIYGRKRFPLLVDGWEIINSFGFDDSFFAEATGDGAKYQPIFVLKNTRK